MWNEKPNNCKARLSCRLAPTRCVPLCVCARICISLCPCICLRAYVCLRTGTYAHSTCTCAHACMCMTECGCTLHVALQSIVLRVATSCFHFPSILLRAQSMAHVAILQQWLAVSLVFTVLPIQWSAQRTSSALRCSNGWRIGYLKRQPAKHLLRLRLRSPRRTRAGSAPRPKGRRGNPNGWLLIPCGNGTRVVHQCTAVALTVRQPVEGRSAASLRCAALDCTERTNVHRCVGRSVQRYRGRAGGGYYDRTVRLSSSQAYSLVQRSRSARGPYGPTDNSAVDSLLVAWNGWAAMGGGRT